MNKKALLAAIVTEFQYLPVNTEPDDMLVQTVKANNQVVADAAIEWMTLDTVPQPPCASPTGVRRE